MGRLFLTLISSIAGLESGFDTRASSGWHAPGREQVVQAGDSLRPSPYLITSNSERLYFPAVAADDFEDI